MFLRSSKVQSYSWHDLMTNNKFKLRNRHMQTQTGTILFTWDRSESQTGMKCLHETNLNSVWLNIVRNHHSLRPCLHEWLLPGMAFISSRGDSHLCFFFNFKKYLFPLKHKEHYKISHGFILQWFTLNYRLLIYILYRLH